VAVNQQVRLAERPAAAPRPRPWDAALPTAPGAYTGLYPEGVPGSYAQVTAFARATGVRPRLVTYYSGWLEQFQAGYGGHGARAQKLFLNHGSRLRLPDARPIDADQRFSIGVNESPQRGVRLAMRHHRRKQNGQGESRAKTEHANRCIGRIEQALQERRGRGWEFGGRREYEELGEYEE